MASPQVEEGFTRIANEVLDKLIQAPLGATELRCVLAIIRRSWGWGKREAEIALKQFAELTARDVESIRDALSSLQKKRVIAQVRPPAFNIAATWSVEKNWELWEWGDGKKPQSAIKTTDPVKNHTPHPVKNHTPDPVENPTPPSESGPQRSQNQPTAAAPKLQKENIKKSKEIKGRANGADPRFQSLLEYFFKRWQEDRGYQFIATPADFRGLQGLLKRTDGQLEAIQIRKAMDEFISSSDSWHRKQGKPLAYFCGNIHAFLDGKAQSKNAGLYVGAHTEAEGNTASAEEMQAYEAKVKKILETRQKHEMESLQKQVERERRRR